MNFKQLKQLASAAWRHALLVTLPEAALDSLPSERKYHFHQAYNVAIKQPGLEPSRLCGVESLAAASVLWWLFLGSYL